MCKGLGPPPYLIAGLHGDSLGTEPLPQLE